VRIIDALRYATGPYIWRTEHSGVVVQDHDKLASSVRVYVGGGIDATDALRTFARREAWDVRHLWSPPMPEIVVQYLRTGDESLRDAAREVARDTAVAATTSAVASVATRNAAEAAANAAADAAKNAAAWDTAWYATWSATEAAAWAAANAATRSAAEAAVWDAARATARARQNHQLTRMIWTAIRKVKTGT